MSESMFHDLLMPREVREALMKENAELAALESATPVKHDQEKIRYDLFPPEAYDQVCKVLTFGAKKYAAHNWTKGFQWSRLLGAALRHIFSWARGEDKDPETGLSHLAHAVCCLIFLIWHERYKPELDDRFKDKECA